MKTIEVDFTKEDGTIKKDITFDEKTVKQLMKLGFDKGCCPHQFCITNYEKDFEVWLNAERDNRYNISIEVKKYASEKSVLNAWNKNLTRLSKLVIKIEKIMEVS